MTAMATKTAAQQAQEDAARAAKAAADAATKAQQQATIDRAMKDYALGEQKLTDTLDNGIADMWTNVDTQGERRGMLNSSIPLSQGSTGEARMRQAYGTDLAGLAGTRDATIGQANVAAQGALGQSESSLQSTLADIAARYAAARSGGGTTVVNPTLAQVNKIASTGVPIGANNPDSQVNASSYNGIGGLAKAVSQGVVPAQAAAAYLGVRLPTVAKGSPGAGSASNYKGATYRKMA
jgi:hypothetical protein